MMKTIGKYLALAAFMLLFITVSDHYFGIELTYTPIPKEKEEDVREVPWMSSETFRGYLMDHSSRVSDLFPVTDYYYPNVNFWFMIYTQFNSSQIVIHDKNNLAIIYKVLDFAALRKKELSRNVQYVLQQKLAHDKMDSLRSDLGFLAKEPFSLEPRAQAIYQTLKMSGVDLPINEKERSKFFKRLKDNLRAQTGQKNFIRDGVMRSLPYQKFLRTYFESRKLPPELLAVPFLESSFNPKAESKVAALGIWQFMPLIGNFFMPKTTDGVDYRSNIGTASVAASFLMSENFKSLKSWDLAVTAYNSGAKHLLKTKRKIASDDVNLERIIKHSDSEHFGFASKNFYSEFLALVHTLAYREELFPDLHEHDRYNVGENLNFYISKCTFKLDKVLNDRQLDDVMYHNHQVKDFTKTYAKGLIITSKEPLPSSKFAEIKPELLRKRKPKDWIGFFKNQSCSTR